MSTFLSTVTFEQLTHGITAADLAAANLYPQIRDEPDTFDWIQGYYEGLVTYFADAAAAGDAMIVWLDWRHPWCRGKYARSGSCAGIYAAAVRPVLIAEVAVTAPRWVTHVPGIGWLAVGGDEPALTVLGLDLGRTERIDVPVPGRRFQASLSDRHVAVVSLEELIVHDRQGRPLWRCELALEQSGLPCDPGCHLDAQDVLWVYLPNGDELVAYDAATGAQIDRVPLDSDTGAAVFWPHPDRRRIGLHVAMGQDAPLSYLACLENGRITGRTLPGDILNGYDSTGRHYLALPHSDGAISIRDLPTGEAVATRHIEDLPERYEPGSWPLMEAAAFVSDDYVLVALDIGNEHEDHVLLSTRTLRPRITFYYGHPMTHNSIAATDGHGRWITNTRTDDRIRLWQLPHPVDAMPGQQRLW